MSLTKDITAYNSQLQQAEREMCDMLSTLIDQELKEAESKIWHRHPVWFLDGNPIVGYSKQKNGIRLMFWSGASFGEANLKAGTGKFKDASIFYTSTEQINSNEIRKWLKKSQIIQWDYKNIVKRKGKLVRLNNLSKE